VAQQPWCGISRRLRSLSARAPQQTARPLRLLLCIASPKDLDAERSRLDFGREDELLFTALDRPPRRAPLWLRYETLAYQGIGAVTRQLGVC
jgi:hypothetical protein